MPKAWVWGNWINPLKYGIEATIMNEFLGTLITEMQNDMRSYLIWNFLFY